MEIGRGVTAKLISLCEITKRQRGETKGVSPYGSRAEALKGRQRDSAGEASGDGGVA